MTTTTKISGTGRRVFWMILVCVLFPAGVATTVRTSDAVVVKDSALAASVLPVPAVSDAPATRMPVLDGVTILDGPPSSGTASGAKGIGGWMVQSLGAPGVRNSLDRIGRRPGTGGFLGRLGR